MPVKKLREFLDEHKVKYVLISHSPAFTMSEIAATAHICGKKVAKTVMVKMDGKMAMVILPSDRRIDFEHLEEVTGVTSIELAPEAEFKKLFPGCEVGAMPPFGNLYGLDVYVSPELAEQEEIVFNAGTHTELLQLDFEDFTRLVHPKVPTASFGA